MTEIQFHPFAEKFPMLPEGELQQLAESIRESGQQVPIIVRADGVGVDGRNRYAACKLLCLNPWIETRELTEEQTLAIIADLNVHRRHLSDADRRKLAAEYAELVIKTRETASPADDKCGTAATSPQYEETKTHRGVTTGAKAADMEAAEKFGVSPEAVRRVRTGKDKVDAERAKAKREAAKSAPPVPEPPIAEPEDTADTASHTVVSEPVAPVKISGGITFDPVELNAALAADAAPPEERPLPDRKPAKETDCDPNGVPFQGPSAEAFKILDDFAYLRRLLLAASKQLEEMAAKPGGEDCKRRFCAHKGDEVWKEKTIRELVKDISHCLPFTLCPFCVGRGENCLSCKGTAWITEFAFKNQADERKAKVNALRRVEG